MEQLTQIIIHSTAPAFLLGALASFIGVLHDELGRLIAMTNDIRKFDINERLIITSKIYRYQIYLLKKSIYAAVASAITISIMILGSFIMAVFDTRHEMVFGLLFSIALVLFIISLIFWGISSGYISDGHLEQ